VFYQNFAVGAIRRLGLGYECLKEINPGIIMVSSSITGDRSAPKPVYQHARGGASAVQGISGFNSLTLQPDEQTTRSGLDLPPGDLMAPAIGAAAVIAGLVYRKRTGKGQHIDLSQVDALIHELAVPFLDYQLNGREPARLGNRHSSACPHGAFRCRGEDAWCAIAVFTEEQWRALCRVMGDPGWCHEGRFATLAARKANEDELDELITGWTRGLSAREVMEKLQAVKVPAGAVQTIVDVMEADPQVRSLGTFPTLRHPVVGEARHLGLPYRLSSSSGELQTAPLFGQHTEYVCKQILGMSSDEYTHLMAEGVLEDAALDDMEAWWSAPPVRAQ
jgi:crotonobetainyl-CoA:carnitine CoA-transferase CaiB-like acyl-CoA transferase